MRKIYIINLASLLLAHQALTGSIEDGKRCKSAFFKRMIHGDLYQDNAGANGFYLNELGDYSLCEQF